MEIVIDTSALIAVIVGEQKRDKIVEMTVGNTLMGPGSIPWEIGNAISAMFNQDRLTLEDAQKGFTIFESISLLCLIIPSNILFPVGEFDKFV